ncbi:MAG: DUF2341 domain-containing protein, partial [Lentisphaerae bacterium]|nr:DUF2341 domain-containing protein [Lentisphaerota bacterium]
LTDFPALIVLEETDLGAGFYYDDFLSLPYNDLRFTKDDKVTPLIFEVDSWEPEGKSYVWVRIPELTSSTTIYMFWGKENMRALPFMTDGSVWNEDFLGVWHMNDDTETTIRDSTMNPFNGIKKEINNPLEVDSVVGKGQKFDVNYIDLTGMTDQTQTYTISMWINGERSGSYMFPFDIESGRILVAWGSSTAGQIAIHDGGWKNFGSTPPTNVWHHIAFQLDATFSTMTMYLNGEQYESSLPYSRRSIGGKIAFGSSSNFRERFFPGILDEVRISTILRSRDWIWACWKNQGDYKSFSTHGKIDLQLPKGTIYAFW